MRLLVGARWLEGLEGEAAANNGLAKASEVGSTYVRLQPERSIFGERRLPEYAKPSAVQSEDWLEFQELTARIGRWQAREAQEAARRSRPAAIQQREQLQQQGMTSMPKSAGADAAQPRPLYPEDNWREVAASAAASNLAAPNRSWVPANVLEASGSGRRPQTEDPGRLRPRQGGGSAADERLAGLPLNDTGPRLQGRQMPEEQQPGAPQQRDAELLEQQNNSPMPGSAPAERRSTDLALGLPSQPMTPAESAQQEAPAQERRAWLDIGRRPEPQLKVHSAPDMHSITQHGQEAAAQQPSAALAPSNQPANNRPAQLVDPRAWPPPSLGLHAQDAPIRSKPASAAVRPAEKRHRLKLGCPICGGPNIGPKASQCPNCADVPKHGHSAKRAMHAQQRKEARLAHERLNATAARRHPLWGDGGGPTPDRTDVPARPQPRQITPRPPLQPPPPRRKWLLSGVKAATSVTAEGNAENAAAETDKGASVASRWLDADSAADIAAQSKDQPLACDEGPRQNVGPVSHQQAIRWPGQEKPRKDWSAYAPPSNTWVSLPCLQHKKRASVDI